MKYNGIYILGILCLVMMFTSCRTTSKVQDQGGKEVEIPEWSLASIISLQTLEETENIISTLASDEYGGRKPGTEGYIKASKFVEDFFTSSSFKPFRNNSYQDTFMFEGKETFNVVGMIEGSRDEYVMLCAHLDHLGPADGADKVYNGANDNASGVTAVLQVAKALSKQEFEANILVALFSAEESGLLGSKHLAQRLREENVNLTHVFNFEMIGKTLTTGENEVYLTGFKKSNLGEEMNKAVGFEFAKFLPAAVKYQLFSRSDNFPFYAEFKIPSHTISTFDFRNYDHYHKASDEVELLDVENMHKVINTSTLAIGSILKDNKVVLNSAE